ncbi:MAG: hypothetical protein J1F04_10585 [Oscillospiraceae bacterium]|nr:hypothetical protein [Oscillospiraceae bacterium]
MNSKIFSEAMGELDVRYVDEAVSYKNKSVRSTLIKWGAIAACLCLVAGGVVFAQNRILFNSNISTSEDDFIGGGGTDSDYIGSYSIAVYPPTESEKNVKKADVVTITESMVLSDPLAKHLPKQLPEGFQFYTAALCTTVMKNGTQYNQLRVMYFTGEYPEPEYTEDGGAIYNSQMVFPKFFLVTVFNYNPTLDDHIFSSAKEVTLSYLQENYNAYIHTGECYVNVYCETADPSAVFEALQSIE